MEYQIVIPLLPAASLKAYKSSAFVGTDPPVPSQDRGLTCEPTIDNRLNLQVVGVSEIFRIPLFKTIATSKVRWRWGQLSFEPAGGWSRFGPPPVKVTDRLKPQLVEAAMGW